MDTEPESIEARLLLGLAEYPFGSVVGNWHTQFGAVCGNERRINGQRWTEREGWGQHPYWSGKHTDSNMEEDNCNKETRDRNLGEKDVGQEGGVPKKSDRSRYYNEDDLQNNVMQPPFPLQDTPSPAAKNNAQKRG
ncbi:hypothetical protein ACSBR2_002842 [Camellia fascicularis]